MSRSQVRRFAALAAMVVLVGCQPAAQPVAPSAPQAPPKPAVEQKLVVGLASPVSTLDSQANIGFNPRRYGLFEQLVGQKNDGSVEPLLASSWKLVNDTTWQFTIVQGRTWHDGKPFTVEDAKFSFDRALNPQKPMGIAARLSTIAGATVVDAQTLNVTTKAPDPILLKRVAALAMVPKHYIEQVGDGEFGIKAIGTGPFKLKEFVANDRIVLTGIPEHPTKPALTELTIRAVPEASARLAGLRTGELHVINQVPLDTAEQLKQGPGNLVVIDTGTAVGLSFNMFAEGSPVTDKRVRQAINYAIDKESIAKNIYRGFTKPDQGQLLQPEVFGFNPNLKPYPYDPKKAKDLLAAAGYANGFKVDVYIFVNHPEWRSLALFIQQQLKEVGVETNLDVSSDTAGFLDRFYGRVPRSPINSAGTQTTPAMDAAFALDFYKGTQPTGARFYNNPEFDAAYLPSTTEMNEQRRRDLIWKALEVFHEDPPVVFLVSGLTLWAADKSVTGVERRTDLEPKFENVKRVG